MTQTWTRPEDRRPLTRKEVAELFLAQDGKCPLCKQKLQTKGHVPVDFIDEHLTPLWRGGSNDLKNRGLVCKPCAKVKTSEETSSRAKGYRVRDKHIGAAKSKSPMPGGRGSRWRKTMSGEVVDRETGERIR